MIIEAKQMKPTRIEMKTSNIFSVRKMKRAMDKKAF